MLLLTRHLKKPQLLLALVHSTWARPPSYANCSAYVRRHPFLVRYKLVEAFVLAREATSLKNRWKKIWSSPTQVIIVARTRPQFGRRNQAIPLALAWFVIAKDAWVIALRCRLRWVRQLIVAFLTFRRCPRNILVIMSCLKYVDRSKIRPVSRRKRP